MAEEHLVFGQALEALFLEGLEGKLTPSLIEKPPRSACPRQPAHGCVSRIPWAK